MKKLLLITATVFFIQMGNAQVSFKPNGQSITSNSSWDIRLVDIDGDNDLDAYFENRIWLNDSLGNFTNTNSGFGTGTYTCFADFNGDGYTDVVCNDSIFLNDGAHHFSFSKKLISDISMYKPVLGDIDKDGDIDIISCSDISDRILLNDGNGNFTNTNKSLGGWGQSNYAFGDINGDGFTDIYVSIPHIPPMGGHTPNLIWLGDGAGNFTQKTHDIAGVESRGVVLTDFDADGDLDLYVSDATSWGRIFINDGTSSFIDSGQKLGIYPGDAKAADFNNDGNLDLFICQGDGNGVTGNGAPSTVWLGDGKGKFSDSMQRLQIGNTNSIAVDTGDINNDGKTDAFVVNVKLDEQNGFAAISCPVEIWLNSTFICDYFGQTPPGNTAVVFAPEILSILNTTQLRFAFSPNGDEFYYTIYSGQDNSFKIYFTKRNNNTWTAPLEAPFSVNREVLSPFISADGNRLYFTEFNSTTYISKIYMVERNSEGGWGEPILLPSPINVTNDGNYVETVDGVGYLDSNRPGSLDSNGDIWCIRRLADQSLKAESLGSVVNTKDQDSYPCVAPDGSFLIFSSTRSGKYGNQDLFISFNKGNNAWTVPISMERSGAKINVAKSFQDYPSITPDGKFLFFRRANSDFSISNIYWVSTHILDTLKKIAMPTVSINQALEQNVKLYPNPTSCQFSVSFGSTPVEEAHVTIFNIQGTQVFSKTFQNSTSATIDLTGNSAGIYVVKVIADGVSYEEKILKE